jgi:hypothetical protein
VQVNRHEKRRIVGSSLINSTRKSDRFFPPALQAKAFSTKLERDLRIVLWQPSEVVTFYKKSPTTKVELLRAKTTSTILSSRASLAT